MATTSSAIPATMSPKQRRRRVFRLALPAVAEQVLNTLVGITDIFLVGHLTVVAMAQLGYTSEAALAGVGLANQMVWLVTVFFMATSIGSTALIARAKGAGDIAQANRVLRQSLIIGLLMGLFATLFGLFLAPFAMQALGAADNVVPLGVTFLNIVAIGFIPAALLFIGTAALRGMGDTRTPLFVMLGVNATNIVLSVLLVNGNLGAPILGVAGAAIGSAIARGGGGLFLVGLLMRGQSGFKLSLNIRPDWGILRRIVKIGAPSGGEQLVFQGALLVFVRFVTGISTTAYAAHNVVIHIESLSFLPGMGYAVAASTLVGQSLGAQDPREGRASAYEALLQGGIMMTVLGAIMMIFPQQLLSLFVADPAVAQTGAVAMFIAGMVQPFLAVNFILSGALRGAGDTRWPLYTKIISVWGIRLPLVMLLLYLGLGLTGVWIAMAVDFAVQAALAFWRFHSGKWQSVVV
ncbi:MAG: MATE family efflux transporter [Chloroflexota bacterium]